MSDWFYFFRSGKNIGLLFASIWSIFHLWPMYNSIWASCFQHGLNTAGRATYTECQYCDFYNTEPFSFYFLRQSPFKSSESDYFEGSGYAKVLLERFPSYLQLQQKVETRAKDALLLYLGDENDVEISLHLLNVILLCPLHTLHRCISSTGLLLQRVSWRRLYRSARTRQG